MKAARAVPKGDELTELISSRPSSHLFNVASQSGKSKRGSAPTASLRKGSNGTFSKPSLPKHWNRASLLHKITTNGATNISFKSLAQQHHHHHHPRRVGSFDSFETGSSASCWSDSSGDDGDDSTTYDSISIGSESCASYASGVSDIIWEQVVRTLNGSAASSDSNTLTMGGSGNTTITSRNNGKLLHSKLRWNLVTMLGILALLALSGLLVYLVTTNNYQSMVQISKQEHDNTASKPTNNDEQEREGRYNQLRLSYQKLSNTGNIVEMVPNLPLNKDETTGKKEEILILKRDTHKGRNNEDSEAALPKNQLK